MIDQFTENAIRELEAEYASAPGDAQIALRLAEAYHEAGVFHEGALRVYQRAVVAHPERAGLNEALSIAHLARNVDEMVRGCPATWRGEPSASQQVQQVQEVHQVRRVQQASRAGDLNPEQLDEHTQLLKGWLAKYPGSVDLWKALGDLQMLRGRFFEAVESYRGARARGFRPFSRVLETVRRVLETLPITGAPALYFAEVALEHGQDDLAEPLLKAAIASPLDAERTRQKTPASVPAGLTGPPGPPGPASPTGQTGENEAAWRANRATALLCDMLERRRNHTADKGQRSRIALEIAQLRFDRGDLAGAVAGLSGVDVREGARQPDFNVFLKTFIRRLADAGDYRQAFDYLSRMPMDPEIKALFGAIGASLERRGENDTAAYLAQFVNENALVIQEARRLQGRERAIATQVAIGDLHFENGRPGRALRRYAAALRMGCAQGGEVFEKIEKIVALHPAHLPVEALMEVGKSLAGRAEGEPDLWTRRAMWVYQQAVDRGDPQGESRRALRGLYDQTLAQNPNQPLLRLGSGDLFVLAGELNKAIAEFKFAAQFPQTELAAARRLAAAYMRSRNLTLALDCYLGTALDPSDVPALAQLMKSLEDEGLIEDAVKAGNLIAGVAPAEAEAGARLRRLQERLAQAGEQARPDPKMKNLIGEQAARRYRYVEKIGSGGMGTVHKVFDLNRKEAVAMKILREGLAHSGKAVERFFREARIAATLNHPNIVMIHDYNINAVSGRSYIVMEFVDGPSLRARIEARLDSGREMGPRDVAEDLYYCAQVCDALDATHHKGIIHRDIKPDNVLVTLNGLAKLTDFGIMHMEEATFTPTGALVGTPRYMAPEQVRGDKIDGRSDLYSIGIILYELMVGSPPFVSGDVSYQQVNVAPTPPRDITPAIPKEVNLLILRCLQKNPDDRPASARALKTAIERSLFGPLAVYADELRIPKAAVSGDTTEPD